MKVPLKQKRHKIALLMFLVLSVIVTGCVDGTLYSEDGTILEQNHGFENPISIEDGTIIITGKEIYFENGSIEGANSEWTAILYEDDVFMPPPEKSCEELLLINYEVYGDNRTFDNQTKIIEIHGKKLIMFENLGNWNWSVMCEVAISNYF